MKETRIPEIEYLEFSERVHKAASANRIPIVGSFEVTFKCNFRCIHCYCVNEKPKDELSYNEICSMLDEVTEQGCLWLLLTGGEPLLRKDFLDIYHYARRKGIIVSVFTNGSLITEEIARTFSDLKPFVVEVTVYGITPDTYKAVTGEAENFYKVMDGIELLRKHRIPLKLKSMIIKQNVHELEEIKRFAVDRGISYRFDPVLNPAISGSTAPIDHILTPEEIVGLDTGDEERLRGWEQFCDKFVRAVESDKLYTCGAGRWGFHIDPEGKVSVCMFARQNQYDLRKGDFKEAFYKFFPEVLGQKRTRITKCSGCKLKSLCGQCPGWAYMYSGDEEEPVDYLCRIAHARAKAFELEAVRNNGGVV